MKVAPTNVNLSEYQLNTMIDNTKERISEIYIQNIELKRLEALLEKAGILGEKDKTALQIYEEALSISEKG